MAVVLLIMGVSSFIAQLLRRFSEFIGMLIVLELQNVKLSSIGAVVIDQEECLVTSTER